MDKKKTTAVIVGVVTAAAVLLVASLLRSAIRNEAFAEAIKTPYLWFAGAVAGLGAATALLKKNSNK